MRIETIGRATISDLVEDIVEWTWREERANVLIWLIESNPDIDLLAKMPIWRAILWAVLHPVRFAVATAQCKAAVAIERGDHTQGMAARRGETGTGSTAGNSPVSEGDAA